MKTSHIVFFCLFTILMFYLFFQDTSSSSTTYFPGRRFMMEFKTTTPRYEQYTAQVSRVDRRIRTTKIKGGPMVLTYSIDGEGPDELIYHTDYHGVTTHPTPTPKHPKP